MTTFSFIQSNIASFKMEEKNQLLLLKRNLQTYIIADNPTTCPHCGSRTWFVDFICNDKITIELHQCNQLDCSYLFLCQEDDLFNEAYWADEERV